MKEKFEFGLVLWRINFCRLFQAKWEIVKRCSKYEWPGGDIYCKLCMEEKLTIATYELINQKAEIFNICRYRKNLVNKWIKGLIKIVQHKKKEQSIF